LKKEKMDRNLALAFNFLHWILVNPALNDSPNYYLLEGFLHLGMSRAKGAIVFIHMIWEWRGLYLSYRKTTWGWQSLKLWNGMYFKDTCHPKNTLLVIL
jgi:hypothetical protein